jgi:RimJ/RimL family protein N-acetyltransferase
MTELRTERLILRRARPDDLAAIHAVLTDQRVMHYWSTGPHSSLEQSRAWLESMIDSPPELSDDFMVTLDGGVIGKLGTWRLPEIGFAIRSDHWGNGFAAEAMAAFLPHVFARPEVDHLMADVDPRNAASLRLLTRFGFVETGRATGTWQTHIGLCDSIYLKLERSAWLSAGSPGPQHDGRDVRQGPARAAPSAPPRSTRPTGG